MSLSIKTMLPPAKALGFFSLALLVLVFFAATSHAAPATDSSECLDCHEDVAETMKTNPHLAASTCTDCHGSADTHLEEGGGPNIFAFKDEPANVKSKACLDCHTKNQSRYMSSPHAKASMDCTVCHSVHAAMPKPGMLKSGATKNCLQCHEDIWSQFQLNERHRLQEGILGCTSCHDPHEPSLGGRLGGFKHEACLKCHTDKGGPFLFEHGASRIEGCSACHEVHGSPNRHMLTQRSVPDLCFSCHAAAVSWHSRFTSEGTNCVVCHSTIHGSNLNHRFLR